MSRFSLNAVPALLLACSLLTTSIAQAQDVRAAEEGFRRAGERYLRRDFAAAANFYEASYRSVPSWQALAGAVRSHRQAEGLYHMTRAATLSLQLREHYATNRRALALATQTLNELQPRLAHVTITCDGCEVEVDGVLQNSLDFFAEPGSRAIAAHWGERLEQRRTLELSAGQTETLTLERPIPPPEPVVPVRTVVVPPPPPPFRFHPAVAIASGGVALGLGIGAAVSWWADALPKGAALIASARMGRATLEQERAVYSAEDRTSALVVGASIVGAFAVTAAILTRWRPERPAAAADSAPVSPPVSPQAFVVPMPNGVAIIGQF
ncbi:MAG: hypothetical protein Q8Q09_08090 [Deltaproteobacteria bacterium]|nr:hypothetical protein [Deltaproteobacteria bacterium]